MKTKMLADFQICISVPLKYERRILDLANIPLVFLFERFISKWTFTSSCRQVIKKSDMRNISWRIEIYASALWDKWENMFWEIHHFLEIPQTITCRTSQGKLAWNWESYAVYFFEL